MTKRILLKVHEARNTSSCNCPNTHTYSARAELGKWSCFWYSPESDLCQPAQPKPVTPHVLHCQACCPPRSSRFQQGLQNQDTPAACSYVNWPNCNKNLFQPEFLRLALVWHQNRLFLSLFTLSFDSNLILLLTQSAKWIPKKMQECCLVLEQKCAEGTETCSLLQDLHRESCIRCTDGFHGPFILWPFQVQKHQQTLRRMAQDRLIHSFRYHTKLWSLKKSTRVRSSSSSHPVTSSLEMLIPRTSGES